MLKRVDLRFCNIKLSCSSAILTENLIWSRNSQRRFPYSNAQKNNCYNDVTQAGSILGNWLDTFEIRVEQTSSRCKWNNKKVNVSHGLGSGYGKLWARIPALDTGWTLHNWGHFIKMEPSKAIVNHLCCCCGRRRRHFDDHVIVNSTHDILEHLDSVTRCSIKKVTQIFTKVA